MLVLFVCKKKAYLLLKPIMAARFPLGVLLPPLDMNIDELPPDAPYMWYFEGRPWGKTAVSDDLFRLRLCAEKGLDPHTVSHSLPKAKYAELHDTGAALAESDEYVAAMEKFYKEDSYLTLHHTPFLGFGVVSRRAIPANTSLLIHRTLENITQKEGIFLLGLPHSNTLTSSIVQVTKKGSAPKFAVLLGALSYVNSACTFHSNITQRACGQRLTDTFADWSGSVCTTRDILPGQELFFDYEPEYGAPCIFCRFLPRESITKEDIERVLGLPNTSAWLTAAAIDSVAGLINGVKEEEGETRVLKSDPEDTELAKTAFMVEQMGEQVKNVLVVVNKGNVHWLLLHVNVQQHTVTEMDSIGNGTVYANKLAQKLGAPYAANPADVQQQTNESDCGMFVILHMLDIAMGQRVLADGLRAAVDADAFMKLVRLRVAELLGDVWRVHEFVEYEEKAKRAKGKPVKSSVEKSDTIVTTVNRTCPLIPWYNSIVGGSRPVCRVFSPKFKALLSLAGKITRAANKRQSFEADDVRVEWLAAAGRVKPAVPTKQRAKKRQ